MSSGENKHANKPHSNTQITAYQRFISDPNFPLKFCYLLVVFVTNSCEVNYITKISETVPAKILEFQI